MTHDDWNTQDAQTRSQRAAKRAQLKIGRLEGLLRELRRLARDGDAPAVAQLLWSPRTDELLTADPSQPGTLHSACPHSHVAFIPRRESVPAWIGWEICTDCGATRPVDGDHTGRWS